jgi:LEA14-like dessication related protein
MKKILGIFLIGFFLFSCSLKDVKYTGFESIKDVKFDNKQLDFTLNLKVKNENGFNLKLKPSHLDVLLQNNKVADLMLNDKVKFRKKSENVYSMKLSAKLAEGALFSLLKVKPHKKIDLQFKGQIKIKAMGFSKKIDVDETQAFDLSLLKNLKLLPF